MLLKRASITQIPRLFISILFIFSGLIKLNDPVGFSLTIETYLQGFVLDFGTIFLKFIPYSLLLAIGVCVLEIVLGLALLINFQTKWMLRALFALTGFFTLLTLYTLWLKRVDSCGCLSEAIPLAPRQSFLKNILILLMLYTINKHKPFIQNQFPILINLSVLILATGLSIYMGWYTYHRLPIIDFGRYPIGTAISYNTRLHHSSELETIDNIGNQLPVGISHPAENSFVIWDEAKEITPRLLKGTKLLCIIQRPDHLTEQTQYILTTFSQRLAAPVEFLWLFPLHIDKEILPSAINSGIAWASTSLLRSMLKAGIGFVLLQDGVIVGKWSYRNLHQLQKHLTQLGYMTPH